MARFSSFRSRFEHFTDDVVHRVVLEFLTSRICEAFEEFLVEELVGDFGVEPFELFAQSLLVDYVTKISGGIVNVDRNSFFYYPFQ